MEALYVLRKMGAWEDPRALGRSRELAWVLAWCWWRSGTNASAFGLNKHRFWDWDGLGVKCSARRPCSAIPCDILDITSKQLFDVCEWSRE